MARDAKGGSSRYAIAAVDRAMDVVATLVRIGPAKLSDIAAEAGCDRVSTFRALHTLRARGLVLQDEQRGRWRLGTAWLGVARAAAEQRALAYGAAPTLRVLAQLCGHTVQLGVRDGHELEVVAATAPDGGGLAANMVGRRWPLHAGPGRLLLAYASIGLQRSVMSARVPRYTATTRTDRVAIAGDLARIRERGWLITTSEVEDGVVTVSSGVQDAASIVMAVLSIHAPVFRMRHPRAQTLLTPLMEAAAALGKLLTVFRIERAG